MSANARSASWVVAGGGNKLGFAGDTGYTPSLREIGKQLGPFDLAAVPIGGYSAYEAKHPNHVNPEEALMIHADVGAKRSLGIHWGTFPLTDEPLDQPPRDLAAARRVRGVADDAFFVLPIGSTKVLTRR